MEPTARGERLATAYARAVVALRFVLPVAWIAAAVAAWLLLPPLGGSSTAPLDDVVATDAPAFGAQERLVERFGSTLATDTLVVQRDPRGLGPPAIRHQARAAASELGGGPLETEGVRAAVPVPDVPLPGVRWPEQGTTIVTYLFLDPELNLAERDEAARKYASRLGDAAGTAAGVTGAGPARLQQFAAIEDGLPAVTVTTIAAILLIVSLYFRSVGAPLVTLLTATVAYAVGVRVLAWVGERAGVRVPDEIEPVLVVLLLGLVTDYTIFFMAEGRRALLAGEERLSAARVAAARIGPVVLTAGVVVAASAAALLVAGNDFFRVFGPGLALAALVVTAVCLTFVPPLLGLLGPWLFGRPAREAAGTAADRTGDAPHGAGGNGTPRPAWALLRAVRLHGSLRAGRRHAQETGGRVLPALGARVLATRPVALAQALVLTAALALAAFGAREADLGMSFIASLPADAGAKRAAAEAARGFGPGILAPTEVLVEQPGLDGRADALTALQEAIGRQDGVAAVLGPAQSEATPFEGAALSDDGGAARLVVLHDSEPTGADAIAAHERLRDGMPALLEQAGLPADARVSYAGQTALAAHTVEAMAVDFWRVAAAALGTMFVLLALFLRALVAPLLLLAGSALAFGAAVGLTTLLLPEHAGGADFVFYVPLVAGVLLLGLGSDYNVLVAGRIRAEARRRRLREAIAVATPAASRAITVAGMTLAATFALLALVPLRPFRELALLMAIGVLVDALVVRPLLIPALLALAGRAAWWPGRTARPPEAAAVVARVAARSGRGPAEAHALAEATLATLGERLPRRETRELADHLPAELAAALRGAGRRRERFDAEEFTARVARRAGEAPDRAAAGARAVVGALADALPAPELEYLRASLPEDYAWLFDDVSRPAQAAR